MMSNCAAVLNGPLRAIQFCLGWESNRGNPHMLVSLELEDFVI